VPDTVSAGPDGATARAFAREFPASGLFFAHVTGRPVTRFQVMGERSSGTNLARRLIARNTPLAASDTLGWKHGFGGMTAVPPDMVLVLCVRDAAEWVLSMHRKPWHCTPAMQRLAFPEFIRAEWDTIVDEDRYFEGAEALGLRGQPLQHDRHPLTGARFADIFDLRRAKLAYALSWLARDCNVAFLRLETLAADPEACVAALRDAFALPASDASFRGVTRRLGSRFRAAVASRPETPAALSAADAAHLAGRVDTDQERLLGYSYRDR